MGNELSTDDLPIYREFVTEARGHLASAESQLLAMESDPGSPDAIERSSAAISSEACSTSARRWRHVSATAASS